jgi:hypothetical protein
MHQVSVNSLLSKPLRQTPFENDSTECLPFQSLINTDKMNPIQLAMLQSSRTRMLPPITNFNYSKFSSDNNNFDVSQNHALNNSFNINLDSIYDDSEDNFDL